MMRVVWWNLVIVNRHSLTLGLIHVLAAGCVPLGSQFFNGPRYGWDSVLRRQDGGAMDYVLA